MTILFHKKFQVLVEVQDNVNESRQIFHIDVGTQNKRDLNVIGTSCQQ